MLGFVAAAGAVGYLSLKPTEEDKLLAACEEILLDRLKAPSTYTRTSSTPVISAAATLEQFMGWDAPGARQRADERILQDLTLLEAEDLQKELFLARPWTRYSTWIEYDAANDYGTPVRGAAECVLIQQADRPMELSKWPTVRVDGFSALDWSVHQLWLTRQ